MTAEIAVAKARLAGLVSKSRDPAKIAAARADLAVLVESEHIRGLIADKRLTPEGIAKLGGLLSSEAAQ